MSQPFYRYTDKSGTVHIVDAIEKVPQDRRDQVEKLLLDEASKVVERARAGLKSKAHHEVPFLGDVHLPSFGFGAVLALAVVILARVLGGGAKLVLKMATMAALVLLLGGVYFGWVKRSAGLGDSPLASPQDLVDEAKKAAAAAKKRIEAEKHERNRIEEPKR